MAKINYVDSKGDKKSVLTEDLDGKLEVGDKMELINTTSLDVAMITSIELDKE